MPAPARAGDWWPYGEDARRRYRRLRRPGVIDHEQMLCLEALALHGEWAAAVPAARLAPASLHPCPLLCSLFPAPAIVFSPVPPAFRLRAVSLLC